MVSLENRINYLSHVENKPKLKAFYDLIYNKPINFPPQGNLNETDTFYYEVLLAIKEDNKQQFEKVYSRISKRKPTKDSPSPFVHDDFLIFVLMYAFGLIHLFWVKFPGEFCRSSKGIRYEEKSLTRKDVRSLPGLGNERQDQR